MDTLNLGQIIEGEQQRDATHIAVAPVVAFRSLAPGEHVGLNEKGEADNLNLETIGIIDPFLKARVMRGERCWLFLYPGTITGLRHEWTHPAFESVTPSPATPTADRATSEAWLRQYAKRVNSYDDDNAYDNLIAGAKRGEIYYHGSDLHCAGELQDADEFLEHLGVVLGRHCRLTDFEYSCSC